MLGRAQKAVRNDAKLYFGGECAIPEVIHGEATAFIECTVGAPGEAREGCKSAFGRLDPHSGGAGRIPKCWFWPKLAPLAPERP